MLKRLAREATQKIAEVGTLRRKMYSVDERLPALSDFNSKTRIRTRIETAIPHIGMVTSAPRPRMVFHWPDMCFVTERSSFMVCEGLTFSNSIEPS